MITAPFYYIIFRFLDHLRKAVTPYLLGVLFVILALGSAGTLTGGIAFFAFALVELFNALWNVLALFSSDKPGNQKLLGLLPALLPACFAALGCVIVASITLSGALPLLKTITEATLFAGAITAPVCFAMAFAFTAIIHIVDAINANNKTSRQENWISALVNLTSGIIGVGIGLISAALYPAIFSPVAAPALYIGGLALFIGKVMPAKKALSNLFNYKKYTEDFNLHAGLK